MASLKIGSLNVGGFHSPIKQWRNTMVWKVLASAPFTSKAWGVVILVKDNITVTLHCSIIDPQGRFGIVDATVDQSRFILSNIYAPNIYFRGFFLQLLNKLSPLGKHTYAFWRWLHIALHTDKGPYWQWRFPLRLSQSMKFRVSLDASWESYAHDNVESTKTAPILFWKASKAVLRENILSYCAHSYMEQQATLTSAYQKCNTPSNEESQKSAFDTMISQAV